MTIKYSISDIQNLALKERMSVDQFLLEYKEYKERDGFIYLELK